jgi:hypothetical protein
MWDHPPVVRERLDDLQVYKRLLRLVEELEALAAVCWSPAAATALRAAGAVVRTLASGLFRARLAKAADLEPDLTAETPAGP